MSKISYALLFAAFFTLVNLQDAQAYLDPGTGSYIFQITIAFLFGALAILTNFWRRIIDNVKKLIGIKKEYTQDSKVPFKDE